MCVLLKVSSWGIGSFLFFLFCCFCFVCLFFEAGSPCVDLTVLELTIETKLS